MPSTSNEALTGEYLRPFCVKAESFSGWFSYPLSMPLNRSTRTAILFGVGVLLLLNHAWLFPVADGPEYTLERKPVDVENGELTYLGVTDTLWHGEYSNLNGLDCLFPDTNRRACAFDAYLVEHGPVTISPLETRHEYPEYAHIDGQIYRRTIAKNETTHTYDVERIPPREFLEAVAFNTSSISVDAVEESTDRVPLQVAVTGEPRRTTERLDADDLGRIYQRGGEFYTVVVTDKTHPEPPIPISAGFRATLRILGIILLMAWLIRLFDRVDWPEDLP